MVEEHNSTVHTYTCTACMFLHRAAAAQLATGPQLFKDKQTFIFHVFLLQTSKNQNICQTTLVFSQKIEESLNLGPRYMM